jgi:hypothetical protein
MTTIGALEQLNANIRTLQWQLDNERQFGYAVQQQLANVLPLAIAYADETGLECVDYLWELLRDLTGREYIPQPIGKRGPEK